mmetsp:Transcript_35143/g.74201  ORF Transcript_35143/g.74201 Transcript_35143/m.74201 type:complete len:86 (+) Transcript_35143:448-705(+)
MTEVGGRKSTTRKNCLHLCMPFFVLLGHNVAVDVPITLPFHGIFIVEYRIDIDSATSRSLDANRTISAGISLNTCKNIDSAYILL